MDRLKALPVISAALIILASCQGIRRDRSAWPPDDFQLDLRYWTAEGGRSQVKKHARIFADGLVVYREAESSIRSADGKTVLPVYRRVSAYRMHWKSIRLLSRHLDAAPVKELDAPPAVPPEGNVSHRIGLQVTYMSNVIDVVAENQTVGLMNRVVRIINAYLPKDHAISMPNMLGDAEEYRLQDVPPVTDSVVGAKQFHERWLAEREDDSELLRDTFALACEAKDWSLAQSCVSRLAVIEPAGGAALAAILTACRVDAL